jgi:hypothetical protein
MRFLGSENPVIVKRKFRFFCLIAPLYIFRLSLSRKAGVGRGGGVKFKKTA